MGTPEGCFGADDKVVFAQVLALTYTLGLQRPSGTPSQRLVVERLPLVADLPCQPLAWAGPSESAAKSQAEARAEC